MFIISRLAFIGRNAFETQGQTRLRRHLAKLYDRKKHAFTTQPKGSATHTKNSGNIAVARIFADVCGGVFHVAIRLANVTARRGIAISCTVTGR
ncbi:MAG: hypothetical protein GX146_00510 [Myxococcales bacterium]|nr:hypothetical protein [Myxococcales bacterium]